MLWPFAVSLQFHGIFIFLFGISCASWIWELLLFTSSKSSLSVAFWIFLWFHYFHSPINFVIWNVGPFHVMYYFIFSSSLSFYDLSSVISSDTYSSWLILSSAEFHRLFNSSIEYLISITIFLIPMNFTCFLYKSAQSFSDNSFFQQSIFLYYLNFFIITMWQLC